MSASSLGSSSGPLGGRRPRLSDDAATHVRVRILSGELKAGEFIRPEVIAGELGISATPAREGLLQLQTEGLLAVEPRRGFVVTALSPKDVNDSFEAQALLAGELCARTAGLATSADIKALQSIQSKLEQAAKESDFAAVEELNIEFHSTIYRISDSPKIHWLLGSTQGYAPRGFFPTIPGWTAASAHDHRAILKALRASDGEAARTAMASHLRHAGELLAKHLAHD